jgi:hypothetical protein
VAGDGVFKDGSMLWSNIGRLVAWLMRGGSWFFLQLFAVKIHSRRAWPVAGGVTA